MYPGESVRVGSGRKTTESGAGIIVLGNSTFQAPLYFDDIQSFTTIYIENTVVFRRVICLLNYDRIFVVYDGLWS